jgi:ADP-heptose:LPS heptosyltransferase
MNVLIVRPDGIGDVVLSLPVATQLKTLIPSVTVGFLTNPAVAPVLEHHPDVDYVRTIGWMDPMEAVKAVFSINVDAAIFLKPFRRLMWAAFLARVPLRVATGFRWYSVLANRRIYQHRSDFSKHESEYNVGMLKGLRLSPGEVVPPRLTMTDAERGQAEARWRDVPRPRVIIHPGGVSARRWKAEHFRDLACALAGQGYGVVFTGNAEEGKFFKQEALARAVLPAGIINCMGSLSVRELMGMIAMADVVVSGATGPAHLAAALGTATVSLFDPRRNNLPTRWRPLGRGVVLRPDVPTCEKCIGEACPFWDCLDRLTVHEVSSQVQQAAKSPSALTVLHF